MGRAKRSDVMQRAMSGLCVAWKPLIAPQAIVRNRQGNKGLLLKNVLVPHSEAGVFLLEASKSLHISGKAGILTNSMAISANAMNMSEMANNG